MWRRDPGGLENLLLATGRELARGQECEDDPAIFRLIVEGRRQRLNATVQKEVHDISRELLCNAFRHAQGSQVEAEIRYRRRALCLHIRE